MGFIVDVIEHCEQAPAEKCHAMLRSDGSLVIVVVHGDAFVQGEVELNQTGAGAQALTEWFRRVVLASHFNFLPGYGGGEDLMRQRLTEESRFEQRGIGGGSRLGFLTFCFRYGGFRKLVQGRSSLVG